VSEAKKIDGRRERSRLTRRRIVDAATRAFVRDGFLATTIEDVAEHAGVAVQTVYYVFGTKPKLLAAVLDASIVGDVEPVAVLQRGWVETLRAEKDATAAVQRLVEGAVMIVARATPIYEVIRRAAADADVGALLADTRRRRRDDQRQLIEILAQAGHLHQDVDVDTAADVLYAVINEEVFQLLTVDCGWALDRFVGWVTGLLQQQLLRPAATPA
jgi:AcrR family transcriptional regulator